MSLVHDDLTKVQLSGPDGEVETLWARTGLQWEHADPQYEELFPG